jgi:hypothetical protein
VSALTDALANLRVRVLTRIADRKGIGADEATIRILADVMADRDVLAELARRQRSSRWLWGWMGRRPQV